MFAVELCSGGCGTETAGICLDLQARDPEFCARRPRQPLKSPIGSAGRGTQCQCKSISPGCASNMDVASRNCNPHGTAQLLDTISTPGPWLVQGYRPSRFSHLGAVSVPIARSKTSSCRELVQVMVLHPLNFCISSYLMRSSRTSIASPTLHLSRIRSHGLTLGQRREE